jgi:hypothetical protein
VRLGDSASRTTTPAARGRLLLPACVFAAGQFPASDLVVLAVGDIQVPVRHPAQALLPSEVGSAITAVIWLMIGARLIGAAISALAS